MCALGAPHWLHNALALTARAEHVCQTARPSYREKWADNKPRHEPSVQQHQGVAPRAVSGPTSPGVAPRAVL
eukprot:9759049-Alexandrium_andersonii.AAC.1